VAPGHIPRKTEWFSLGKHKKTLQKTNPKLNPIFFSTDNETFYYGYILKTFKPMNLQIAGYLFHVD